MAGCTCGTDAYWGKWKCFKCGASVGVGKMVEKEYKKVTLPTRVRTVAPVDIAHWKHLSIGVSDVCGFYIGRILGSEFIVMPVYRGTQAVFYSARRITGEGKKYLTSPGAKKEYWVSNPTLTGRFVLIAEGIADAAHLSELASSVALMGMNYDGSLDTILAGKHIIVVLDGDEAGRFGSFQIAKALKNRQVNIVMLTGDPTDYSINELRKMITDQLKVTL